jgi:hypothetical protein
MSKLFVLVGIAIALEAFAAPTLNNSVQSRGLWDALWVANEAHLAGVSADATGTELQVTLAGAAVPVLSCKGSNSNRYLVNDVVCVFSDDLLLKPSEKRHQAAAEALFRVLQKAFQARAKSPPAVITASGNRSFERYTVESGFNALVVSSIPENKITCEARTQSSAEYECKLNLKTTDFSQAAQDVLADVKKDVALGATLTALEAQGFTLLPQTLHLVNDSIRLRDYPSYTTLQFIYKNAGAGANQLSSVSFEIEAFKENGAYRVSHILQQHGILRQIGLE